MKTNKNNMLHKDTLCGEEEPDCGKCPDENPLIGIEKKRNKGWDNVIQKPLNVRWKDKVGKPDQNGCWNWTGKLQHYGYGVINNNYKSVGAHRVSYELHFGKIPKGMFVLHKCDNPKCVNPNHLFLGTQSVNLKDMFKKGRNRNQYSDKTKSPINGMSKSVEAFIGGAWVRYKTMTEGAKQTGALIPKISMVVNNRRKKAGGLLWRQTII